MTRSTDEFRIALSVWAADNPHEAAQLLSSYIAEDARTSIIFNIAQHGINLGMDCPNPEGDTENDVA